MPPTHYLRIEGVNLSRFVFDTRDLSTIRGGGLMLLDAVEKAREALAGFVGKDPKNCAELAISEGASIGLFGFALPGGKKPDDAADAVRNRLTGELPHATFVVDVCEAGGDFRGKIESLLAKNRWRQMQSPTLDPPRAVNDAPENSPACEYDGLRPARKAHVGRKRDDGSHTWLSKATAERTARGREAKQKFYEAQIKKAGMQPVELAHDFANEFEHIAARSDKGPLSGKLAVFYADGNSFAAAQSALCKSPEEQSAWDGYIRGERAKFLSAFLDTELKPANDEDWLWFPKPKDDEEMTEGKRGKPRYRFETLLWGGDEVLFVMPAWQGWRFAARFFEAAKDWNTKNDPRGLLAEKPLTHTAALIFCQHHSPIHRIQNLAKEKMAESAKGLKDGRTRNQLVYQVLESMDHLGADYAKGIQTRYRDKLTFEQIVLHDGALHTKLAAIAEGVRALKDADFPRSQLRALVTGWLHKPDLRSFEEIAKHLTSTAPAAAGHLKNLSKHLGDGLPLWVHLEELWDYAAP